MLMISHDLGMIARYCHRIIVMCQGEIVEQGTTHNLFGAAAAPLYPQAARRDAASRTDLEFRLAEAPVVAVRDLVVDYGTRDGLLRADAQAGTPWGEPGGGAATGGGCGRRVGLRQDDAGACHRRTRAQPSGGNILFEGKPIARSEAAFWSYRLNCQMIFQDPYSSLDPRMTVGALAAEPLRHVKGMTRQAKAQRVEELLAEVGLGDGFASRYPHELSGGQRQRVAIARAVARRPKFVIADEPVSALDVTVRAQILALFSELQARHGFSCLFICHDLGVVEQVADRVIVMQEGRIIEEGARNRIFDDPKDIYTRRLLSAVPTLQNAPDGSVRLSWRGEREDILARPSYA